MTTFTRRFPVLVWASAIGLTTAAAHVATPAVAPAGSATPASAPASSPAATRETYTRKVAIVLYEGVELLDFAGPGEVFKAAASFGALGREPSTSSRSPSRRSRSSVRASSGSPRNTRSPRAHVRT